MPPKVDASILIAKRDGIIVSLYERLEEFQVLYKLSTEVLKTARDNYG